MATPACYCAVKTKEKMVVMAKFITLSRNATWQTGTGKVLYLTINVQVIVG